MPDSQGYIKVFFDGGSRGNPGPSAIGAVVYNRDGEKILEHSEFIGKHTNNVAEYMSLDRILDIVQKFGVEKIVLFTDSMLVHNQLKKIWKIKDKKILEIFLRISEKLARYKLVDLRLVPREQNREADRLVNIALDRKEFSYDGESGINFGTVSD
ncbi:MAG: ribonuclease HI family protein [Actinobacteria bacterium]|nr:ribonuclease HI family protein [Actinomycetota bacterium]